MYLCLQIKKIKYICLVRSLLSVIQLLKLTVYSAEAWVYI